MAHRKPHLPEKTCPVCGLRFCWRRKWANCWEQVKYCSERCRRQRQRGQRTRQDSDGREADPE